MTIVLSVLAGWILCSFALVLPAGALVRGRVHVRARADVVPALRPPVDPVDAVIDTVVDAARGPLVAAGAPSGD